MSTALFTHADFLNQASPEGHPESADRIRAVWAALEAEKFSTLVRLEAPIVEKQAAARAHTPKFIEAIYDLGESGQNAAIDGDTWISPGAWAAAQRAAGAVVKSIDMVMGGEVKNAFCAVRPPGHHAESERAMGFCLLSTAAIGALHALEAHGLSRVAVVDFDVHHGNGTQEIFERDGRVLYISSHEWPLFPGTGREEETGVGNLVNMPLPPGTRSDMFRAAYEAKALPALESFQPELMIISAGFDGHAADPLARMMLTAEDFSWITDQLCEAAERLCSGRVVSTLEGGYDLAALNASVAAHVEVLMAHGVDKT